MHAGSPHRDEERRRPPATQLSGASTTEFVQRCVVGHTAKLSITLAIQLTLPDVIRQPIMIGGKHVMIERVILVVDQLWHAVAGFLGMA